MGWDFHWELRALAMIHSFGFSHPFLASLWARRAFLLGQGSWFLPLFCSSLPWLSALCPRFSSLLFPASLLNQIPFTLPRFLCQNLLPVPAGPALPSGPQGLHQPPQILQDPSLKDVLKTLQWSISLGLPSSIA